MFWWLYGSQQSDRTKVPLVLWLQGGPGASSLFGDFMEIGPLDAYLKPRNTTWLMKANLLFVDNPVGSGFSYTKDPRGYCKTDMEIAKQLVFFLQQFLKKYTVFQNMPFCIFSESYGGKMTSFFGVELHKAIQRNDIKVDFKGVALGDSWIDPIGCMYSYPPFLKTLSLIDKVQADNLTTYAILAEEALKSGNGSISTYWWGEQQNFVELFTSNVNFYNILYYTDYLPDDQLNQIMAGPIPDKLKIIPAGVTWGGQSGDVFEYMSNDFMKSGIHAVDILLAEGYQVAVYSGQMDLIVDVICIDNWIEKLQWPGLYNFLNAPRIPHVVDGIPQGFSKIYKNFSLWNVMMSGHMVPYDNPEMSLYMFETIIN